MKIKKTVKDYLAITVGTIIITAGVYFFMLPSQVPVGSASALALVLSNLIPLPVSVITFIINMVLLVLGFLLIGPEFGAKTIYASVLLPAIMYIFEVLFPNIQSINQDGLLDVLCCILLISIGQSFLFSCNASSGGLDIVAKLMNKYLKMELGKAISISGLLVASTSIFYYDLKTMVLAFLGTYFAGVFVDYFIFGLNIKRKVCIISSKLDEIVPYVLHDLHSGATLNEIIGAYDRTVRKEVIVIVDKQEYRKLMDFVHKVDPSAFITVYSVNEIHYTPKK